MKKVFLLLILIISKVTFGQSGTWTWISGDSVAGSAGVFGTIGVPSVNNHPPGMYEPCEWKDKQGNFWVYGGFCSPAPGNNLWKYNPLTNEWTWVNGTGTSAYQPPIYGIKGTPDPSNTPGSRAWGITSWVDTTGNLWMFGGYDGKVSYRNDLWKYDIGSGNWTWMSGDSASDARGVHGTQGVTNATNIPGARNECPSAWTDSLNNLWLFAGNGYDDNGLMGNLNDVWKYDIGINEWTWMKGSALKSAASNYGIKGISSASNDPGARWTYAKWKDEKGSFWITGGYLVNGLAINDIWKYDPGINEWTWMDGPAVGASAGNYMNTCAADTINMPYSRYEQRSSVTDNCGRFWMFGGTASSSFSEMLNDLWVFDPEQLKWEWINGTNSFNQAGNHGMLGVPSPSNTPPSRVGAVAWWGNDNKFYLFGGYGYIVNFFSDLWVFNPDTNCVITSCNTVAVMPPIADFQADKTAICANDCINFTDLSSNATSWQWNFAGALDSTSAAQNPQFVCYSTPGIYNVTLIASNSAGSDTLTLNGYITVSAAPPTPVITQVHNDTLFCSTNPAYAAYQWYIDSLPIAGATDTFLVISTGGDYNVKVTNAGGCKTAVGINVILGLQNYMKDNPVMLFPNPVGDKFTVYGLQFTVGRIDIYNVLGQLCRQSAITNPQSEIDVSTLTSGIYFVQLIGEKQRWTGRFVKE